LVAIQGKGCYLIYNSKRLHLELVELKTNKST
jgi:hypothetical protein